MNILDAKYIKKINGYGSGSREKIKFVACKVITKYYIVTEQGTKIEVTEDGKSRNPFWTVE